MDAVEKECVSGQERVSDTVLNSSAEKESVTLQCRERLESLVAISYERSRTAARTLRLRITRRRKRRRHTLRGKIQILQFDWLCRNSCNREQVAYRQCTRPSPARGLRRRGCARLAIIYGPRRYTYGHGYVTQYT